MNQADLMKTAVVAAMVACPAAGLAQVVDFAQLDASTEAKTLVLVRALKDGEPQTPDPLLSAAYTRFSTGSTGSVGYMHRWAALSGRHNWLLGAGVGANRFRTRDGRDDESGLSARGQTEFFGPVPGGSYYALVQASSFRDSILGVLQYNLSDSRYGFEVSRYSETGHRHTAAALRVALGERKRWFLRAGLIHTAREDQPFIGLAYNAF